MVTMIVMVTRISTKVNPLERDGVEFDEVFMGL